MKQNNLKITTLLLLVFGLIGTLSSCKKDRNNDREDLVGEWKIKSFTVDGVETMGTVVRNSKMEFEKYSGSNGDFEWQIFYGDGTSEIQTGDYTVDEEDKDIELENQEGERLKLDFDLEGDELELSGIIDGDRYVLKAERD